MSRTITLPARQLRQEIVSLEEYPPPKEGARGSVTVVIGALDADGEWSEAVPRRGITIDGELYEQLTAVEPPPWALDKPAGTYRNSDLWYCIDQLTAGE